MTVSPRIQFSMKTLLVVTLCAVVLGFLKFLGLELLLGFWGLGLSCGFVLLLACALVPLDWAISRLPYWTSFIVVPLLYGGITFTFYIFGEAIDQPHPVYDNGATWFTHGAAHCCQDWSLNIVLAGMLIVVAIDAVIQRGGPKDHAYYPKIVNLCCSLGRLPSRLILIIGGLLVVGCYADSVIWLWEAKQRAGGLIWPPKRVFASCQVLWGLIWLADCASRPNGGTMAGAIGYLLLQWLWLPSGGGVIE